MKFHQDGTLPAEPSIFVFGSNLAGNHAGGAARVAQERFGAATGVNFGWTGDSYAIPTMSAQFQPLTVEQIAHYIAQFIKSAELLDGTEFFLTRVGCGIAGHADSDIAPLFKGAPINCNFPEQWRQYL